MVRVFEVSNEIQGNQSKMCEGVRLLICISGVGMGVNDKALTRGGSSKTAEFSPETDPFKGVLLQCDGMLWTHRKPCMKSLWHPG